MITDRRGQFTVAGLFALMIMLIVAVKFLPIIYDYCEEGAQLAESRGDMLSSFLWRLIPVSIVIAILTCIYHYAKPLILRD
ncbi:hypothetical protein [Archaeoglobus profundus]|uniref:Uncharacterized protein n=1 Tax=Archaeoglobus profundus (strain DSM 5631 / JCM 9629 / NBRC 100127 / Av18) TaxID=572546 RepID=D2REV8_ARCPA|nr:hypothetical protein [Archaeoglobus profundus]ADB58652.1 hypothetical protein Arcpr_1606 [Archaeoglobus profundus DSM 5631]